MKFDAEQLKSVVAALPDPVFILTESGRYAAIFGGSDERYYHDGSSLIGLNLQDLLPADKAGWFMAKIAEALGAQQLITVEYSLAGAEVEGLDEGSGPAGDLWFEGRIQPLPFNVEGERAVVWVARNITRRHTLELELRRFSEEDELTGAFNRRRLLEELQQRYREFRRFGHPGSVIMFDIDYFKRINDRFGHIAGDLVLRELVTNCKKQLRELDLLARFGGEEFVILLPNTGLADAAKTAERLRREVEAHQVELPQGPAQVTISAGVSCIHRSDSNHEVIIGRVDGALYEAKRNGRNRVVAR